MDTLGATLFFKFLKNAYLSVANYFLKEKKLAPEQLCSPLYGEEFFGLTDEWCEIDRVEMFLECGMHAIDAYRLYVDDFCFVCPQIYDLLVARLGNDTERRFFEFCLGVEEYEGRVALMKTIIEKEKIRELLQTNTKYALKLGKSFFNLCETKADLRTMLSIGLTPKDLIDYKILCRGGVTWTDPEMWEILRDELDMKLEDFEKINFYWNFYDRALAPYLRKGNVISLIDKMRDKKKYWMAFQSVFTPDSIFTAIECASLNLNEVVGDSESCGICKSEYHKDDKVLKLDCGHIFHYICVRSYLFSQEKCPYCRTPSPLPK